MTAYLDEQQFAALLTFVHDRLHEDPRPAFAFEPSSLVNHEVNLRRFAARNYCDHPGWTWKWAPL